MLLHLLLIYWMFVSGLFQNIGNMVYYRAYVPLSNSIKMNMNNIQYVTTITFKILIRNINQEAKTQNLGL
jgi:hypothetical protein